VTGESALDHLTDGEIILSFRDAIIGILPVALRLECLQDDTQPYDDYEAVAEALWAVFVERSLAWKYELSESPQLPRYGMYGGTIHDRPCIMVQRGTEQARFVEFIGDRKYGANPFNTAGVMLTSGEARRWPLTSELHFTFVSE
jgi:hypothetical protein